MPNSTHKDFVIENGVLLKCTSNDNILIIPNGVTDIADDALANWKGDTIVCPSSLKNYLYENGLFYFDNRASTVVLSPDTDIQKIWDAEMRIMKDFNYSIGPSTLTIAFSDEQSFKDSLNLIENSKTKYEELYEYYSEKSSFLADRLENRGEHEQKIESELGELYDYIMGDVAAIDYNISLVNNPELDKYYNDAFVSEHYDFKDGVLTFKDADSFRACLYLQGEFPHNVVLSIPNADIVKKIILPKDIETIPNGCLKDFKHLEELEAKSVKEVGNYALCGCSSLKKIELHPDIKQENIGYRALYYCTSLTDAAPEIMADRNAYKEIEMPEPDENGFVIKDGVLLEYVGNDKDVVVPNGITSIGENAFCNNIYLESVILPEGVISIEDYAFYECMHLQKIDFPNSLTQIGYSAFRECNSLKDISLPNGIEKIEAYAFENTALNTIKLPNSITSLDVCAFYGCSYLETIHIGTGIKEINANGFDGCDSVSKIYFASPDTIITGDIDGYLPNADFINDYDAGKSADKEIDIPTTEQPDDYEDYDWE